MPYPRTSAGYPASMRALIEEVAADNLGRRIVLDSEREARSLRARFYQLLAALKRDASNPPAWASKADIAANQSLLKSFLTLQMRVDGAAFIIEPRDETPIADKLRNAEILPPRDGTPSPEAIDVADEVLESLLRRAK